MVVLTLIFEWKREKTLHLSDQECFSLEQVVSEVFQKYSKKVFSLLNYVKTTQCENKEVISKTNYDTRLWNI